MIGAVTEPIITVERVVEWSDTDASGHVHNSVGGRLLEAAEAELLGRLGLADLMPSMPRVRLLLEFHSRLYFGETVTVELRLTELGRSSLTWDMLVRGPGDAVAITGEAVVVHAPGTSGAPWPDEARAALIEAAGGDPAILAEDAPTA
jgi:acyl-CoA thioester hydrolase